MAPLRMTTQRMASRAANPSMDADGPVCIVTGASRGLGRSIALALGGEGCRVVVNYASSSGAAEAVVDEIKKLGGDAIAVGADMSKADGIKSLFDATAEKWDTPVGVLVNNAGITRDTLVLRMKASQWNEVIDTNLNGVFFASQQAAKIMTKARTGRIINVASVVGRFGNVGQANYAAAKAGVIGLTMSMAKECAPRGVTVNAIAPGFIESDMTGELSDKIVEGVLGAIPAGRFGQPEEVAGLVKYLALDPSASYITGHCINIDGGMAIGTC